MLGGQISIHFVSIFKQVLPHILYSDFGTRTQINDNLTAVKFNEFLIDLNLSQSTDPWDSLFPHKDPLIGEIELEWTISIKNSNTKSGTTKFKSGMIGI